jgi:serine phosphatase RsbU (regulator of sigma subunit)
LQQSLEILLQLPGLNIISKGSIFLINSEGNLEMKAEKNLGVLTKMCAIIKPEQCLCGKALSRKKLLFCNYVNHDEHNILPEDWKEHGHFNIPLIFNEQVLGVLNLYVAHNHIQNEDETEFLKTVADVISSVLNRISLQEKLSKQLDTTQTQKLIIEKVHKNITDSITYAKSIQDALLTSKKIIKSYFDEYFLIFKPKEVVSGDFYYVNKIGDYIIFAVADCTGHGVPGGFITILGITYLHEIVRQAEIKDAGEVLNNLRQRIKATFRTFGTDNQNGLDIAFCAINIKTNILQYSGANNPIFIIRNNKLNEYSPTKNPIGFYPLEKDFVNSEIQLCENDLIYLFSDGLQDQFGGNDLRKFQKNRLKELFLSIHNEPFSLLYTF